MVSSSHKTKHEALIEVIKEIREEMYSSYKIKGKNKKTNLKPVFCFRTAELLYEIGNRLKDNQEAVELLFDCFFYCTLNTFWFINLSDLESIIMYHEKYGYWSVELKDSKDI